MLREDVKLPDSSIQLRAAMMDDISRICVLHGAAFEGFFLTSLGPAFLRQLYAAFIAEDAGYCFVAEDENEILGFVAGTSDPENFFRTIRKKNLIRFAVAALPGLLKNPLFVARKCFSALTYKGEPVPELRGAALLSSLAVDPSASGKGVGGALVHEFCERMKRAGNASVYLTTDADENDRVNGFYEKCGFQLEDSFVRPGNRIMNRWVKNVKDQVAKQ